MFIDRAVGALSTRLLKSPTRHPRRGSGGFLFVVAVVFGLLAIGPATTYARRAAPQGPHTGKAKHKHPASSGAGLVAAWGFGGGSGGSGAIIADASGHHEAITLENAALTSAGRYGGAVQFTGRDSYATAAATPSLNLTRQMTLEAWVWPSKVSPGYSTIVAKTRAGGRFPYGLALAGGRLDAYAVIGGRSVKARANFELRTRHWTFVAATYDGSRLRVYLGNRLAAEKAVRGKLGSSAGPLQLGGDQVWGEFFTGRIDNVRIFSKARSARKLYRDARTPVSGGIVHGPLSTTSGPGGAAPGAGSAGGPTNDGPIGPGAAAGIGLPAPSGPPVYVGQSTVGSGDGSSCVNAHSAAWFDSSASWGTGAGQISAGDVVHLCGTISSTLQAHGSGLSGSPIAIYFEPGANISMPVCPTAGCLSTNGQSYILIDGGGTGVVENTANGSGLANQLASNGIVADSCNDCTIEYVTVQNIYQHTSSSDTSGGAQSTGGLDISGSNLIVTDNTIDNAGMGIYADWGSADANDQINGNNIYNTNWAIASVRQTNGGTIGPTYIYANHLHDWANWDTTSDTFHHNGLHCYTGGGLSTLPHYSGLYFYDNRIDGREGADGTASVWPEDVSQGSACGDSTSNIYLFNNVFDTSDNTPGDAYVYPTCCNVHVWNNTLESPSTASNRLLMLEYGGTVDVRNNLFDHANVLVDDASPSAVTLSPAPDYNLYATGGSNAFVCNGYYGFPSGFSKWQSCIHGDSHSGTTPNASLNADGSLEAGSSATGAGTNLTSLCSGALVPLCSNIYGAPRPVSGPWNAGAF